MSKNHFVGAPAEKLSEIIRQAESRLSAQLALGIAADQRAMTLASILATGCAALIAWAVLYNPGEKGVAPVVVMIVGLLIAAGCALWSAQPISWAVVGSSPNDWVDDIAEGVHELHSGMSAMASFYADMIRENDEQMALNANWIRAALVTTFLTLIAGSITALIF